MSLTSFSKVNIPQNNKNTRLLSAVCVSLKYDPEQNITNKQDKIFVSKNWMQILFIC